MKAIRTPLFFACFTCLLAFAGLRPLCAEEVLLAKNGQTLLPIRIANDASERVVTLAEEIRRLLSQMAGSDFRVERSLEGPGLLLRVVEPADLRLFEREDYTIRSSEQTVAVTGNTETALEHGAWDLLHRLGYRQFFPGETWEIVPRLDTIRVEVDVDESPDYYYRRIWYGYGTWDYNGQAYEGWSRRNRMGGSARINSGHAYGQMIRAKQAEFDKHPEFYALVDGRRNVHPQAKLCVANPQLRATVVEYAREYFASHPDEDCISVDPSDGGGWCECEACGRIGPPSDRALLLANEVADAVTPRLVAMYAYNYHSSPPSIAVRPNVCINAATAFIKGGQTIDDIIAGWSAQGAMIGIREYYSVNTWDRDLPGAARGSHLAYLAATIPAFHTQGARFMNAESSDNWGCNGLGYYFASRVLWDVTASEQREAIVADFLNKSFGSASDTMREFYQMIGGENERAKLVFEDLVARMYRLLDKARGQVAADSPEQRRITDLILYTRYVDLFDRYRTATGPARQAAFEQMLRHVYRIRTTMMVHAKGLYRDVPARDKSVVVPENCGWEITEDRNPWKSSRPFDAAEIAAFLRDGIETHEPIELDFEPRQFSDDLDFAEQVVSSRERLTAAGSGDAQRGRGRRMWFTKLRQPGDIILHITGGLIAHYRDRGNVTVSVHKVGGASETGERETLVATDASVRPDGRPQTIRLAVAEAGLYRIELNDGMDMTEVTWPDDQPMTWKLSLDDHPRMFSGRWSLWFFVPEGTDKIGLYVDTSGGQIVDPAGNVAVKLDELAGRYISVDVAPEHAGRLWKLEQVAGKACLLNVPPYAARTPQQLLLPVIQ